MKLTRGRLAVIISLVVTCHLGGPKAARGDLQWQLAQKESVRLRLVALAWNHPRSSFSGNEEVFIAEKPLDKEESRLVKLVYNFLPYQPRLSDYGMDYSTVHELRAVRDPGCDETLAQLTGGSVGDWRQEQSGLKYTTDAPALNLARRSHLPCYVTSADDYSRSVLEPTLESGR